MFLFGCLVLYGGLLLCIGWAIRKSRAMPPERGPDDPDPRE